MDSRTFFQYVSSMREEQKKFFRTKSPAALRESKRLERIIDDEITRVNSIVNPDAQQGGLFGE